MTSPPHQTRIRFHRGETNADIILYNSYLSCHLDFE